MYCTVSWDIQYGYIRALTAGLCTMVLGKLAGGGRGKGNAHVARGFRGLGIPTYHIVSTYIRAAFKGDRLNQIWELHGKKSVHTSRVPSTYVLYFGNIIIVRSVHVLSLAPDALVSGLATFGSFLAAHVL